MDIPRLGITTNGIHAFVASLSPLDGKTTTEVCPFVKDATLVTLRSYVEDLAAAGSPHVGDATAFVSHAWGYVFLDVVAAMEAWEVKRLARLGGGGGGGGGGGPPSPTFFWFDVFSNPQHGAIARPFEWWQTTFKENVRRIGQTLLVLAWEDPKPLKRAWCLVEIVATLEAGAGFEVIMAPREEAQFLGALEENFDSIVLKTCNVDVEKATAYHGDECLREGGVCRDVAAGRISVCPRDLELIKDATSRSIGFAEVNARVIECMRGWMASEGRAALSSMGPVERGNSALILSVAHLLRDLSSEEAAEELLREALAMRSRINGKASPETLVPMLQLANLLRKQGKYGVARPLILFARDARRDALGAAHLDTLAVVHDYLPWFNQEGRAEDEAPYRASLLRCREREAAAGGAECEDTLRSLTYYAEYLRVKGRKEDALELRRELHARCCRADATSRIFSLGGELVNAMLAASTLEEALRCNDDLLLRCRRERGERHPQTLAFMERQGELLMKGGAGQHRNADELLRWALDARRVTQGEAHRDTLTSRQRLASLLRAQGRHAEAVRELRLAAEGLQATRGATDMEAVAGSIKLADALVDSKSDDAAGPLYLDALTTAAAQGYPHIFKRAVAPYAALLVRLVRSAVTGEACGAACSLLLAVVKTREGFYLTEAKKALASADAVSCLEEARETHPGNDSVRRAVEGALSALLR